MGGKKIKKSKKTPVTAQTNLSFFESFNQIGKLRI